MPQGQQQGNPFVGGFIVLFLFTAVIVLLLSGLQIIPGFWATLLSGISALLGVVSSLIRREDISAFFSVVGRWVKAKVSWILSTLVVVLVGIILLLFVLKACQPQPPTPCGQAAITKGIGLVQAPDGECVGVSDGSFVFDTTQPDNTLKQLAAAALRAGDMKDAEKFLSQATKLDPSDAEAQIYQENLSIIVNKYPHITLIIGTTFTGNYIGNARDNLQGAYVAQHEYNRLCKLHNCYQTRLLIADAGKDPNNAATVAQQIVTAAQADPTIIGVMGWPLSEYTGAAIGRLADNHIPLVSPSSSYDLLSGISRYFFRVAPTNESEAELAAWYAAAKLHRNTVAVFYDPSDLFSPNLREDFVQSSKKNGLSIIDTETFTAEDTNGTLSDKLQKALKMKPDLIYFAGHAADAKRLFASLPPCSPSYCPLVMGSNSLYVLGNSEGYPPGTRGRLYITGYAYPDEWGVKPQSPPFFTEYCDYFGGGQEHCGETYGTTRAEGDVIVSYDAMAVLLNASSNALQGKQSVTPDDVRNELATTSQFPGVSGCISFDAHGDAFEKTVLMLSVDEGGHTQMVPDYSPDHLRC